MDRLLFAAKERRVQRYEGKAALLASSTSASTSFFSFILFSLPHVIEIYWIDFAYDCVLELNQKWSWASARARSLFQSMDFTSKEHVARQCAWSLSERTLRAKEEVSHMCKYQTKNRHRQMEDIENFFGINDENFHFLTDRKRALKRWLD